MFEELNELEKIGLAFVCGFSAGKSLQEANQEIDAEEDKEEIPQKVKVEKIEGEKADKLMKFMKELGIK